MTFDQDTPTDGSESGGIPTSAQGRSEASVNAGGRRTFPPASTPPAGLPVRSRRAVSPPRTHVA